MCSMCVQDIYTAKAFLSKNICCVKEDTNLLLTTHCKRKDIHGQALNKSKRRVELVNSMRFYRTFKVLRGFNVFLRNSTPRIMNLQNADT